MEAVASLLPLTIIILLHVVIGWPMAKRKGLGTFAFVLCLVPLVQSVALIWIASKTDASILKRLDDLEKR